MSETLDSFLVTWTTFQNPYVNRYQLYTAECISDGQGSCTLTMPVVDVESNGLQMSQDGSTFALYNTDNNAGTQIYNGTRYLGIGNLTLNAMVWSFPPNPKTVLKGGVIRGQYENYVWSHKDNEFIDSGLYAERHQLPRVLETNYALTLTHEEISGNVRWLGSGPNL